MVSLNIIYLNSELYIVMQIYNFNIEFIISVSYSVCATKWTITIKESIPGSDYIIRSNRKKCPTVTRLVPEVPFHKNDLTSLAVFIVKLVNIS